MNMKMNYYFKLFAFVTTLFISQLELFAQIAKTQVVQLQASIVNDKITLQWPKESYSGKFIVYSRNFGESNYVKLAEVAGNLNNYNESSSIQAKEYLVSKISSTGSTDALGYIYAGNKFQAPIQKGGVVLLIDSSYIKALSNEIIL